MSCSPGGLCVDKVRAGDGEGPMDGRARLDRVGALREGLHIWSTTHTVFCANCRAVLT